MHAMVILMAVFVMVLVVWAVATVVGILRLRNWGRISILIFGGCMAIFGLFGLLGTFMMSTFMHAMPAMQPSPPAFIMQAAMIIMSAINSFTLAIGIWWLIYFNLHKVKAAFVPPAMLPTLLPDGTPDGILLPYAAPPPAPSYFPPAPTAITIMGWFLLVSALCCLLVMLIPFPGFFLGFIATGIGKDLLYLAFAALAAYSGWGLLHLRESGRRVAIAYLCLGIVQMPLLLTP
jgi:hypothetical protein